MEFEDQKTDWDQWFEIHHMDYRERRLRDLKAILKKEKDLAEPKIGGLWRAKFEKHVATTFWVEKATADAKLGIQPLTIQGGAIVLLWDLEYDETYWTDGADERWTMKVIVNGRLAFRSYTSLMDWYKKFEKVS